MALTQVQGGMLAGSTNTTTTIQSNGTTAITINTAQKVGIGTTPSGSYILEVNGNPNFNSVGGVYLTCGTYDVIKNPSGNIIAFGGVTSSQWDTTALYTGGTERMRITSGGNLLVGTSSVQNAGNAITCFGGFYSFCLNSGSFNYYFGTDSNNFNVYSGDGVLRGYLGTAGAWTNTSDIAFKKDIVDIKYSLQDALNLRPVSYLTKDYEIPQIGFIAQEMEQVIPEVVSGKDGEKGISYGSLVALCVKAIQDLNAKVDAQDAEIQELKAELDATKAEVAALKAA